MLRFLAPVLALVITLAAVVLGADGARAQDSPASVSPVSAGRSTIDTDSGKLETEQVDIHIKDASNLAAFNFVLVFDGNLLKVENVQKGDFLGSSGREVFCQDPTIEESAVQFTCVTLGADPDHGADGEGTLASVTFSAKGNGETPVELSRVKLSDLEGNQEPSTVESANIEVFGSENDRTWLFWLLVIGGATVIIVVLIAAGGALLARRRNRNAAPSTPPAAAS